MKIALAQMDVKPGQPAKNVKKMLELIQEAKEDNSDIVVFSELCVGGYMLSDEYNDPSLCEELMSYNDVLREASEGIVLIYGNIFVPGKKYNLDNLVNRDGRELKYNFAYVFHNKKNKLENTSGGWSFGQPKSLMPNYRIFDDSRYFQSAVETASACNFNLEDLYSPIIIEIEGKKRRIGISICEDIWTKDYRHNNKVLNPTRYLIQNGAEMIFNLSASPWTYGKNHARDNAIKFICNDCGGKMVPLYYVNCVGAQNTGKNIVTFDGGTTIYNSNGDIYDYVPTQYKEDLLIVDSEDVDKEKPLNRDVENKIREKYLAIKRGLLHMKDIFGTDKNPKWVVGASGGIDSSLVIALLVDAFGKDNVLIVNMPSKYNSQKTIGAFEQLAKALELKSFVSPITGTYIELYNMLEESGVSLATSLNEENEQAKIRNLILSSIAARENAIYTCNGNKLEIALGYFTLDGDGRGSVAPIADLTKVEIWEMAKFLNEKIFKKEVIPNALFPDKMFYFDKKGIDPSAELKEKQVDPMKWGYHDALLEAFMNYQVHPVEEIMKWYLNGTLAKNLNISVELLERWDITTPKTFIDDIKWFYSSMRKNVFKRVQSPPIIITSKTAFGNDRREAQLPPLYRKKMVELEEKILKMNEYKETV